MFDDTQKDAELFKDSEISDKDTDAADHTPEGDETQLDLSDEAKNAEREEQRQKQIDVWTDRIKSGETTIEDMPKNLHWMVDEIKAKLEVEKPKPTEDVNDLVNQKFEELQIEQRFTKLKDHLEAITLTKSEKDVIAAEYKDLLPGMPKDKALEKAIKIAGVHGKLYESNDGLRANMQLPQAQRGSKTTEISTLSDLESPEDLLKLPPEKRIELYERQLKR